MTDTAEHRAEMFALASARRRSGQPMWSLTIRLGDVFRNAELSFPERRDAIVRRIRRTRWAQDSRVAELLEELADTSDPDDFDGVWDELYDEADYDRVWIDTLTGSAS